MNTTESNKLIAEFMNSTNDGNNAIIYDTKEGAKHKFHTSWDWIMPVIAKCNREADRLGHTKDIDSEYYQIFNDNLFDAFVDDNIEFVYKTAVRLVDWLNEGTTPNIPNWLKD